MKYFFDTEFYEDGKTIDLISLGMVAEDGRELYLCNCEARLDRVSDWVRVNVLPTLPPYGNKAWVTRQEMANQLVLFTGVDVPFIRVNDATMGMRTAPVRDTTPVQFFAYYASYDWVCLCQLFGTMMKLPEHFPRWCSDLKQLSVELQVAKQLPKPENAHDALADAKWNLELYSFLMGVMKSKGELRA
jgi:hypothetical protein